MTKLVNLFFCCIYSYAFLLSFNLFLFQGLIFMFESNQFCFQCFHFFLCTSLRPNVQVKKILIKWICFVCLSQSGLVFSRLPSNFKQHLISPVSSSMIFLSKHVKASGRSSILMLVDWCSMSETIVWNIFWILLCCLRRLVIL